EHGRNVAGGGRAVSRLRRALDPARDLDVVERIRAGASLGWRRRAALGPQVAHQPPVTGLDVAQDPLRLTLEGCGQLAQPGADRLGLGEGVVGGLLRALDPLVRLLARDLGDPHRLGLRGFRRLVTLALTLLLEALGGALGLA